MSYYFILFNKIPSISFTKTELMTIGLRFLLVVISFGFFFSSINLLMLCSFSYPWDMISCKYLCILISRSLPSIWIPFSRVIDFWDVKSYLVTSKGIYDTLSQAIAFFLTICRAYITSSIFTRLLSNFISLKVIY